MLLFLARSDPTSPATEISSSLADLPAGPDMTTNMFFPATFPAVRHIMCTMCVFMCLYNGVAKNDYIIA